MSLRPGAMSKYIAGVLCSVPGVGKLMVAPTPPLIS